MIFQEDRANEGEGARGVHPPREFDTNVPFCVSLLRPWDIIICMPTLQHGSSRGRKIGPASGSWTAFTGASVCALGVLERSEGINTHTNRGITRIGPPYTRNLKCGLLYPEISIVAQILCAFE